MIIPLAFLAHYFAYKHHCVIVANDSGDKQDIFLPPVKCYSLGRVPPVKKHYYATVEKVQSAVVVHATY